MSKARAHLIISGRVQGVFYRAFTEEAARSLGIKGWVRNLPDGGVEALFEGEKDDIEKAVGICRKGPPASVVRDVDVNWEDFRAEFDAFSIRYF
ncbi:MAG: acylphosphatase [Parvibaculum sp.]|uniref:acylphosphatase n=1 Tax=Parvibaculum sp. TaxID=2024848 RepID=UPI0027305F73|nr:acylphosphatase [Parvibaculum sp.]MDP2151614.1 acylphosphatase [Parvibaculum sp.]